MSRWEQAVDYNLTESGVHPMSLRELIGETGRLEALLDTELNYPQVNGTDALRERIAALYPGARRDNVLVTVGAAEANYITIQTFAEAGGEMVVMLPNYLLVWGAARNFGARVKTFPLCEDRGWAPDLDALNEAVTEATTLIAVCNPVSWLADIRYSSICRAPGGARLVSAKTQDRSGARTTINALNDRRIACRARYRATQSKDGASRADSRPPGAMEDRHGPTCPRKACLVRALPPCRMSSGRISCYRLNCGTT